MQLFEFEKEVLKFYIECSHSSIRRGMDKSEKIFCVYLMWKKLQNTNDGLIKEVIYELSLDKDFNLSSYKFNLEYTKEDCLEFSNIILNRLNGKYESAYSSPTSLDKLIVGLIALKLNESFCDFGSGDGKLLLNLLSDSRKKNIQCEFTGLEINATQVLVSKCLMEMFGYDAEINNCDYTRETIAKKFDKVYLYPPFGLRYSIIEWENLKNKYEDLFTSRNETELLYLLKAFDSVKEDGKLIALLPTGVAFRNSGSLVRKYLIENNYIEGIISLPAKVLNNTVIPVDLWILNKSKDSKEVKIVDAKESIIDSEKISLQLDVESIIDAYENEAMKLSVEELSKHDYSLSLSTYKSESLIESISNPIYLKDVCDIEKGSQYTLMRFKEQITEEPTDYQLLTSTNIQDGLVNYESLTYIKPDPKLLKFKLEEGDIVVTTKSTVVKTYVATDLPDRNIIVTGGMMILRPDTSKVNPTYVKMFLDSSIGKSEFKSIIKGNTIGFIPFNDFKDRMIISCPSLDKQNELAEKYNNLLWTINALTKQLEDTKAEMGNIIEESMNEED